MKIGSLFSGIGGFDIAAEWAGMEIAYQVEIDAFCQKVLHKRFPNVPKYDDITRIPNGLLPRVDIICGGFPCQPFSVAGKRRGTEDDRALWREMLCIIEDSKPTWVIGENVPGVISMELDNIIDDLEGSGYEAQTLVIPACAVGAQHIRSRVWILAYSHKNCQSRFAEHGAQAPVFTDTNCIGLQRQRPASPEGNTAAAGIEKAYGTLDDSSWQWYIESGLCRGSNGVSKGMDRLRSLGNAIVPQVAFNLLATINRITGGSNV